MEVKTSGGCSVALAVHEGPHDARPTSSPPNDGSIYGSGRWGQVANGKWYAFYGNVGPPFQPGESWQCDVDFMYEHPDDPNWWTDNPKHDPENFAVWGCRHGFFSSGIDDPERSNCHKKCTRPQISTVTDEEIKATGEKLVALLSSMEASKAETVTYKEAMHGQR